MDKLPLFKKLLVIIPGALFLIVGFTSVLAFCFCCIKAEYRNRHRSNEVEMEDMAPEISTASSSDNASKQANLPENFSNPMDSVTIPIGIQEKKDDENTEQEIALDPTK